MADELSYQVGGPPESRLALIGPWQNFISSDPNVCGGELCLSGTRIPVTVVLDSLAEGSTRDEILRSYPSVRPEHIDAALSYAAELAHQERLVPIRVK
jgi:uncharacterized protein (DUF433 family)